MQVFAQNFSGSTVVHIPKVYPELSSEALLVMEYVEGERLLNLRQEQSVQRRKRIVRQIVDMAYQQLFLDGFFHADLHAGNIKMYKTASGDIVEKLIDWDTRPLFEKIESADRYFLHTEVISTTGRGIKLGDAYYDGVVLEFQKALGEEVGKNVAVTLLEKSVETAVSEFKQPFTDYMVKRGYISIPFEEATMILREYLSIRPTYY